MLFEMFLNYRNINACKLFLSNNYKHLRSLSSCSQLFQEETPNTEAYIEEILDSDSEYNELADRCLRLGKTYNCFVIQPYVKWGAKKLTISPDEQLEEAIALINTLSWPVMESIKVPLESLDKKTLFGSGTMESLTEKIKKNPKISAIFVNSSHLKNITANILRENFNLPILDRYEIVIQILKMHATSKHAKLQVALAELYYIERKSQKQKLFVSHDPNAIKLMFQKREQKIKTAIQELRNQRTLLRRGRQKMEFPVIAVVGYTNCGKTSLIKSMTGEESLQPRNQLFATLDVTVHKGTLPSGLKVLYVDTVGFLSDLPTNLLECFIATLEDAVLADLVLHVEDLASSCFEYKRKTVLNTLKDLGNQLGAKNIMEKVFSVGNKCDLVENANNLDIMAISAKNKTGLEELERLLEDKILQVTARQKITIKVPNGGEEIRWLYKNSTVVEEEPLENDPQFINAKVIITQTNLSIFKHNFIKLKK